MRLILTDRALRVAVPDDGKTAYVDLTTRKIARCVGCFGCWTRTPGRCVIRDDATRIYPLIARSDTLLYVSRIRYGGYDTVMKTMLERAIPVQQAFIRVVDGETHHKQRAVVPKRATIVAYGAETPDELELFRQLIARNARNMNFTEHRVLFVREDEVDDTVKQLIATRERS